MEKKFNSVVILKAKLQDLKIDEKNVIQFVVIFQLSIYFQQEDDETRTSEVKQYLAYNIQRLKNSNHFQSQA